jgi:hypothetical protein
MAALFCFIITNDHNWPTPDMRHDRCRGAGIEKTARSMFVLQEQSALDSPSMSVSELNENFSQIINMTTFYPINRAYTNMTGSGDLKLIRSSRLRMR